MTLDQLKQREVLLVEILFSGLDAQKAAETAGSSMLLSIAKLMIQQTLNDLEATRSMMSSFDHVGTTLRQPEC